MKTIYILSLIAISTSSAAFASEEQTSPLATCAGAAAGVYVGRAATLAVAKGRNAATSMGFATVGAAGLCGVAAGSTALLNEFNAPEEKELQAEPVSETADE